MAESYVYISGNKYTQSEYEQAQRLIFKGKAYAAYGDPRMLGLIRLLQERKNVYLDNLEKQKKAQEAAPPVTVTVRAIAPAGTTVTYREEKEPTYPKKESFKVTYLPQTTISKISPSSIISSSPVTTTESYNKPSTLSSGTSSISTASDRSLWVEPVKFTWFDATKESAGILGKNIRDTINTRQWQGEDIFYPFTKISNVSLSPFAPAGYRYAISNQDVLNEIGRGISKTEIKFSLSTVILLSSSITII
jgi:hypothetical protein